MNSDRFGLVGPVCPEQVGVGQSVPLVAGQWDITLESAADGLRGAPRRELVSLIESLLLKGCRLAAF